MQNNLLLGFLIAVGLAMGTFIMEHALPTFVGYPLTIRLLIVLLAMSYGFCQLLVATRREGRLVLGVVLFLVALMSFFLLIGLTEVALVNGGILVLLQWILISKGVVGGLFDAFVLAVAGMVALAITATTWNLTLAVWAGMLVPCLAQVVPMLWGNETRNLKSDATRRQSRFHVAESNAEAALKAIARLS